MTKEIEEWRYSHSSNIGLSKTKQVFYYYSNLGNCKKVYYDGREIIFTPKYKGRDGERIYLTIVKLFPEICGVWYEGCQVDHINTIIFDNRACNLRCCSAKENMNNSLTRLHCSIAMKERQERGVYKNCHRNHTTWNKGKQNIKESKPVNQYSLDGKFIRTWPSIREVYRQLGYFSGSISACCLGKQKSSYGFIWEYA